MSNRKLLLADDSITIQKVVNLTFADEGIDVISVGDGDDAMRKFIEISPDLVMADVNMPGMDGYKICEMIKQDEATKKIPVILLVGSFEPFDAERAEQVGANDYLTKPFQSIRQLVHKVSLLLEPEDAANLSENAPIENDRAESENLYSVSAISGEFGDAGMDDETIQTDQIGTYPMDEYRKFESAAENFGQNRDDETWSESTSEISPNTKFDSGDQSLDIKEAETEPLSQAELEKITSDSAINEIGGFNPAVYTFANELDEAEQELFQSNESEDEMSRLIKQSYAPQQEKDNSIAVSAAPNQSFADVDDSVFEFDELDLLEIPELAADEVGEFSSRPAYKDSPESKSEKAEEFSGGEMPEEIQNFGKTAEEDNLPKNDKIASEDSERNENYQPNEFSAKSSGETESSADSDILKDFPPEVIDAIAEKVTEKLSVKALKAIADQVAPQMADLVVERMAREKANK